MPKRSCAEFAKSAVDCLYDLDAIGVLREDAIASLENELQELLALNDRGTLKRRHEHFCIPNVQIEDYEEKFYELSAGKSVLAGIRHKSASKDLPFVHILLGFTPTSSDIESLRRFAANQFHKFSPKFLSIWLRPSLQLDISSYEVDQSRKYLVGSTAKIRRIKTPMGYERITLKKVRADFDFSWYSEAYKDFHRQQPELKNWVPKADKEDIERCLSHQLLFEVFVDEDLAGLVGAQNEIFLGKPSVYMTELLLISKFKGQGLAAPLQRKFIDELPENIDLVWGTIDAKNVASLKTALRIGRVPIRSEYFVRLN